MVMLKMRSSNQGRLDQLFVNNRLVLSFSVLLSHSSSVRLLLDRLTLPLLKGSARSILSAQIQDFLISEFTVHLTSEFGSSIIYGSLFGLKLLYTYNLYFHDYMLITFVRTTG